MDKSELKNKRQNVNRTDTYQKASLKCQLVLLVSHHVFQFAAEHQLHRTDFRNRLFFQWVILRVLYDRPLLFLYFICHLRRADHLHRLICVPAFN